MNWDNPEATYSRWRGPFRSAAVCAMPFAILAPIAPWWLWPVMAAGLLVTWSWLALAAAAAGFVVVYPGLSAPALVGALVVGVFWSRTRWLEWTPRGDSLDPVRGRFVVLLLALSRLRWRGRGRGSMARDLRRWRSCGVAYGPLEHLHCEPVQLVYEHGWRGGLVVLLASAALIAWVRSGSPWAAAGVSAAVLCLGHAPLRLLAAWLRSRLLPTDIIAEITVHVRQDGTAAIFAVNMPDDSPEILATVASAIVRGGLYWGQERGLHLVQFGDFTR
jgi:hypothetical protein